MSWLEPIPKRAESAGNRAAILDPQGFPVVETLTSLECKAD
jgi:hypothetical protein